MKKTEKTNKPQRQDNPGNPGKAEKKQPLENKRFRAFVENSSDIIVLINLEGVITYINPAVESALGFKPEERIGAKGFERVHPDDMKFLSDSFNILATDKNAPPIHGEMRLRHKDGSWRAFEAVGSNFVNGDVIEYIIVNYRDITERKKAEEDLHRSEERYRTILEDIREGYFETDLKGNLTFFNDTVCRVLGYTREELMGMSNRRYTDKNELRKVFQAYNQVYATGEPCRNLEWQIIRKDGTKRYVEGFISLLKNSSGQPIGFRGISHDITERKQIEQRLLDEEQRFRALADQSSDIIILVNNQRLITYENQASNVLGITSDKRIGINVFERVHPDDLKIVTDAFDILFNDVHAPVQKGELRLRDVDGNWRIFEAIGSNLVHENVVELAIINLRDITERKKAEETLTIIKRAVESSSDAIGLADPDGNHFYHNDAFTKLFGYTAEELHAMGGGQTIYADKHTARAVFDTILAGGSWSGEVEFLTKSGTALMTLLRADAIHDDQGKIIGLIGVHTDITDRKKAENLIKESEEKYRLLADHMKDQVWVMDLNMNITYVSPSVERVIGYTFDEIKKMDWSNLITEESLRRVTDFISRELPRALKSPAGYLLFKTLELEFIQKSGQTLWGECAFSLIRDETGRAVSILGEARNITERKQAEEKLQQTMEKLKKAVGTTIQVLVSALEARDPYTSGHQSRSADLACAIAEEMGLNSDIVEAIRMAGIIHDIGKLSIPAEILSKPTKLSALEYSLIKVHPQTGYEMLKDVESPWPLADIVYQHHERMNGTGYPQHIKGDEILMEARILAVADVVEAMASHRPYRASLGIEAAMDELKKNRGILYDEAVVDACLRLLKEKGYKLA